MIERSRAIKFHPEKVVRTPQIPFGKGLIERANINMPPKNQPYIKRRGMADRFNKSAIRELERSNVFC
jgi:hypothetical protein